MANPDWPALYTQSLANGFSFDLILVKGGSFFIGNSDHEIHVPDFYMAKYPVTQALWLAVMGGENPAYFKGMNRPVESVSWYDAAAFCNALNAQCGFLPRYFTDSGAPLDLETPQDLYDWPYAIEIYMNRHPSHHGYCLPTESAWEYAAISAQHQAKYKYVGGNYLNELGWYNKNSHGQTHPVGLKMSNKLGLYDLSGNVCEWCEDHWCDSYEWVPADGSSYRDLDVDHVVRGGSWLDNARHCRFSYRDYSRPTRRAKVLGFRLMLVPPPGGLVSS